LFRRWGRSSRDGGEGSIGLVFRKTGPLREAADYAKLLHRGAIDAVRVALRFQPSWARTMLKPDIPVRAPVQSFLKKVKKSLVTPVFTR